MQNEEWKKVSSGQLSQTQCAVQRIRRDRRHNSCISIVSRKGCGKDTQRPRRGDKSKWKKFCLHRPTKSTCRVTLSKSRYGQLPPNSIASRTNLCLTQQLRQRAVFSRLSTWKIPYSTSAFSLLWTTHQSRSECGKEKLQVLKILD